MAAVYIYIYIYIERERDRDRALAWLKLCDLLKRTDTVQGNRSTVQLFDAGDFLLDARRRTIHSYHCRMCLWRHLVASLVLRANWLGSVSLNLCNNLP